MQKNHRVRTLTDVKTPMRDGVDLSSDIYLPDAHGKFPTVLIRTPYDNAQERTVEKARRLASNGYACVAQDVRGRWDSDGRWYALVNEGKDGYDTQEWIGQQEWSDGKIGMSGSSYLGHVQWQSAQYASEYLTCIAPRVIQCDFYHSLYYGGAFNLHLLITWGMSTSGRTRQTISYENWTEAFRILPLIDMDEISGYDIDFWKDWVRHPTDDEYWDQTNVERRFDNFQVPALVMGGWYDVFSNQTFRNYTGLVNGEGAPVTKQSRLIVGAWPHGLSTSRKTGDIDFGAGSMFDLEMYEMKWFDYWLRGRQNGVLDDPPIKLFVMGINQWRDESEWPLARTDWQRWNLHSAGGANTVRGDGALSTDAPEDEPDDHFVYDPRFPVPTLGGNTCCSPDIVPWGPYDQRPIEMRSDVLCYTSAPLEEDMEVTGPISVVLHATTDGRDTDWTAKLVDVSPSGYAMNLCDGIRRARYRESMTEPTLLEPNRAYEYEIELTPTSNVFKKGHMVRVEISSSNFPHFDRNPNTGNAFGLDAEMRTANQTVHHSRMHPSHILLPVIPSE